MANQEHLKILKHGIDYWNSWREQCPEVMPDLRRADFSETDLSEVDFSSADLSNAILRGADLMGANLRRADLRETDLREAHLSGANLDSADLRKADLSEAYLGYANLCNTLLSGADFSRANLQEVLLCDAHLSNTILSNANLYKADLTAANLNGAILVGTNLTRATLIDCSIHGISAWKVQLDGAKQLNLTITSNDEPTITVDNLEVAQFIYLLLNNRKIRDVINIIGQKGVLILGRFSEGRKPVLDALREKLRTLNFLPIVFDFERSTERDFTETILTLAGLSCFIIADITNPKSAPLELQITVPNYMIPFVPIIQEGEQPFSMFQDLAGKYDWVLDILVYDTPSNLINGLERAVVEPALEMRDVFLSKKVEQLRTRHIGDYL